MLIKPKGFPFQGRYKSGISFWKLALGIAQLPTKLLFEYSYYRETLLRVTEIE